MINSTVNVMMQQSGLFCVVTVVSEDDGNYGDSEVNLL